MSDARPDHVGLLAAELRERLIEQRRALAVAGSSEVPDLPVAIAELVAAEAALLSETGREEVADRVLRETVGLGPLEELLRDPDIEEVLVNGHEEVWIERRGSLERAAVRFDDEEALRDVIERVLGPIGRRVDELSPMADGRLPDGSRVNVVIPPLSVDGPAVSIRRFAGIRPDPDELVARDSFDAELRDLLAEAVGARRNLIISGGTGSGKTTVLNALSSFIAPDERVITIEDAAELQLGQPHVVRLESRPAGIEGSGEVTIRDLVRNALRMRPDRIVIGEVRGAEAMDLLVALNTGHRGALSTVHANGARGCAAAPRDPGDDGRPRRAPRGRQRAARRTRSSSSSISSAMARGGMPSSSARWTRVAGAPAVRAIWSRGSRR